MIEHIMRARYYLMCRIGAIVKKLSYYLFRDRFFYVKYKIDRAFVPRSYRHRSISCCIHPWLFRYHDGWMWAANTRVVYWVEISHREAQIAIKNWYVGWHGFNRAAYKRPLDVNDMMRCQASQRGKPFDLAIPNVSQAMQCKNDGVVFVTATLGKETNRVPICQSCLDFMRDIDGIDVLGTEILKEVLR